MYTIKVTFLKNKESYEDKLNNLSDYHNPNPEIIEDFPPLEDTSLIDSLDLSFRVMLPLNDGEDFFYQYLNKPIFSAGEYNAKSRN